MRYLFKNIAQFVKHSKVIFAVFVICEITSLMLIIFSYGIYQNYSQQVKDIASNKPINEEQEWLRFDFASDIDEDNSISNELVFSFITEFGEALGNKIGDVSFNCNGYYMSLSYDNGWQMYDIGHNLEIYGEWYNGRYLNKKDYDNAVKVCVAPIECYKEIEDELNYDYNDEVSPKDFEYQAYDRNGKKYIDLPEGTFEVVGFTKMSNFEYYIPYTVMPLDAKVTNFPEIEMKQILYKNEYNKAVNIIKKYFGEHLVSDDNSDMPVYDAEVLKTFKTKMTISIIIAIISSINIAALFKFVIEIRRKQMSIFRINGCTKNKLRRMLILEMLFYSIVNSAVCISIFHFVILPKIADMFPYISLAYTLKGYGLLILIYLAVTYIIQNIMIISSISRSPVKMLKVRR